MRDSRKHAEEIRQQIKQQVSLHLKSGPERAIWMAKHMVGKDWWQQLPVGHKRQAGIVLSQLVEDGELPFEFVGKNEENQRVYRRTH